jgi:hypothetical protein
VSAQALTHHDALLTWCSERGSGTLDEFTASCAYLGLDAHDAMRGLSCIGHVEFDLRRRRFAAAPPTLATIPGLPAQLLLTGARPYGLVTILAQVAGQGNLDIDVHREGAPQFGYGPSTFFVEADARDAPAFCEQALIRFGADAHRVLADQLPDIRIDTATVAHTPDTRFPHARVDPHTFRARWDQDIEAHQPGLWLYRTFGGRPELLLVGGDGRGRLVLDNDYAPYLMDRPGMHDDDPADPIIEYRRATRLLIVNAAAPLPILHARAACLCSGRLPIRRDVAPDVAYQHYVNVDPHTGRCILQSLGVTT